MFHNYRILEFTEKLLHNQYNDLYGHDYGDKILINFSKLLCSIFRKSDIISRFGGDEFCIIMDDCNIFEAKIKCQKLQESLIENQLIINEKINPPLTISIGISQNTIQIVKGPKFVPRISRD